jgi:hypothetical protein
MFDEIIEALLYLAPAWVWWTLLGLVAFVLLLAWTSPFI